MSRIFTKNGDEVILPTQKRTYQGRSKNTKYSKKSNSSNRKRYRGQGTK
jgi:hypothetical protein